MSRLPKSFYQSMDVIRLSKELIGKKLVSCFDGKRTAGIIVETEAYLGEIDRASHAYGLRRTARTEVMFREGGLAYVYLCYGIHHLFNVVVSPKGIPHAILIRGLEPVEGIDRMLKRCNKSRLDRTLTSGPGSLTRALGITTEQTGISLIRNTPVWIEDSKNTIPSGRILSLTRVGVEYAKEDALLPYRFLLEGNPYVSKGKGI
ncbi:MAG: DNA-3-methyladenine glycosylase [Chitinophagaceae bacterium]|jgi:DNA-3-methyladenine glycosylase|nr:MAG: DNA-3-methyladenine glycosylase [Chitinophagaceae bacterium]